MLSSSRRSVRALGAGALAVAVAAALAACGGDEESGDGAADGIKVWIQEDLPDRVAATQKIVDSFTAASSVKVELVPVVHDVVGRDVPELLGDVVEHGPGADDRHEVVVADRLGSRGHDGRVRRVGVLEP